MSGTGRVLEWFMISVYAIFGLIFLFTDLLMNFIAVYRELWGGLMLAYAGYRAYVTWKRQKAAEEENNNNNA